MQEDTFIKKAGEFLWKAGNVSINRWSVNVHAAKDDTEKKYFVLKLFRSQSHVCAKGNRTVEREWFRNRIQEDNQYNQTAEAVRALKLFEINMTDDDDDDYYM